MGDNDEYDIVAVSRRFFPGIRRDVESDVLPKARGRQIVFREKTVNTEYGLKLGVDVEYGYRDAVKTLHWETCHPVWVDEHGLWLIDATHESVRYAVKELDEAGYDLYLSAEVNTLCGDVDYGGDRP